MREERGVVREGMEGGKGSSQRKRGRKETGLLKLKGGVDRGGGGGGRERKGALDTVDYREERKSQHLKKNKRW